MRLRTTWGLEEERSRTREMRWRRGKEKRYGGSRTEQRDRERKTDFFDCSFCLWEGRGNRGTEDIVGDCEPALPNELFNPSLSPYPAKNLQKLPS